MIVIIVISNMCGIRLICITNGIWAATLETTPVRPKINNILKILDPSTLPITIPLSPFLSADTDAASSGKEVPIAKIVRPTSFSLIPHFIAIKLAPPATSSEPMIIPIKPIII